MTAQIDDHIIIGGKDYRITKTSHGLIFNPKKAFGIEGTMRHTGCWRGYQAIYTIMDNRLVVQTLKINLSGDIIDGEYVKEKSPVIEGVTSVPSPHGFYGFSDIYKGIDYPIFYSGGVIGLDDYFDFDVRFYPFPLSDYRVIVELIFEDGKLVHLYDHTDVVAEFRKRFPLEEKGGRGPTEEEAREFNEKTFSFEYECHIPFGLEL